MVKKDKGEETRRDQKRIVMEKQMGKEREGKRKRGEVRRKGHRK